MVWAIVLIADVVLIMVMIEDVLRMIEEYWYRNPSNQNTTTLTSGTQNLSNNTAAAAEHEPAMDMVLGRQQGARPCWTPETIS